MGLEAVIHQQNYLLTINRHKDGEVVDAIPGVHVTPCFLDSENGVWVLYARFDPGTLLPRHYHTGVVHFYTTKGSWNYVEYPDDVQTEGSYLFEPGGSIHTFQSKEGAEGFMVVHGANVNLNEDDTLMFIMDAGWIEQTIIAVAKQNGQKLPRYIKPKAGSDFSDS
ncbi:MAG: 2,4'-dihydroxyacetophenone dioxygenase [Alphaproteobacteria bacterium]|nr:MAG: 2,4'-dihydroxyacetophenone dioxygenase [Alphaproteobacteria bacterium]